MSVSAWVTAFLFAFVPALCWLAVYRLKDRKDPEPKRMIARTFFGGALMAVPFLLLRQLFPMISTDPLLVTGVKGALVFALFEEAAKLSAAIWVVSRSPKVFNQIVDGMVYAVTAALGFAFVENLFYFHTFASFGFGAGQWVAVVGFRSLGTMLAHTLFSGIAGLLWGYAVFSKKITPFGKDGLLGFGWNDLVYWEAWSLHIIRRNVLIAHPSRRGGHEKKALIFEGIVLASLLHAAFNLLVTFRVGGANTSFLAVPALMGGFLYASYLFAKKRHQEIFRIV